MCSVSHSLAQKYGSKKMRHLEYLISRSVEHVHPYSCSDFEMVSKWFIPLSVSNIKAPNPVCHLSNWNVRSQQN